LEHFQFDSGREPEMIIRQDACPMEIAGYWIERKVGGGRRVRGMGAIHPKQILAR